MCQRWCPGIIKPIESTEYSPLNPFPDRIIISGVNDLYNSITRCAKIKTFLFQHRITDITFIVNRQSLIVKNWSVIVN